MLHPDKSDNAAPAKAGRAKIFRKFFACPLEVKRCNTQFTYIPGKPMSPKTCPPGQRSDAYVVAALDKMWEITSDDIKSEWMDIMVKRLFRELNRQLAQVESLKPEQASAGDRVQNARVLSSLERTLERLSRLEKERVARRERKGLNHDDARAALERRLDKLVEP